MPIVAKDKIVAGSDDPTKLPFKKSALLDDTSGISLADAFALVGDPSSSVGNTQITAGSTTVTHLATNIQMSVDYDTVQVQWQRGTGNDFEFRQTFEFSTYEIFDTVDTPVAPGGAISYPASAMLKEDTVTERALWFGRTPGGQMTIQAVTSNLGTRTTLAIGDLLTVSYVRYGDGLVGGKFRKRDVAKDAILVLHAASGTTTAPTGITYHGEYPIIPSDSPYADIRTPGVTGQVYYWAQATYDYHRHTYTIGTWSALPATQIHASTNGSLYHAMPVTADDRFVRVRKSATSRWEAFPLYGEVDGARSYQLAQLTYDGTDSTDLNHSYELDTLFDLDANTAMLLYHRPHTNSSNMGKGMLVFLQQAVPATTQSYSYETAATITVWFYRNGGQNFTYGNWSGPGGGGSGTHTWRINFRRDASDPPRTVRYLDMWGMQSPGADKIFDLAVYGVR